MKNNKGFTLIELLVVIAIIGLLATMAVASLKNPQSKSRDARRVADIKQIRTALELYLDSNASSLYPVRSGSALTLGGTGSGCLGLNGFQTAGSCTSPIFMGKINSDPGVDTGYVYSYGITTGGTYAITFGLT